MKFGFIGAGNICSAIIMGAVTNGIPSEDIYIYNRNAAKQTRLADESGVNVCAPEKITAEAEIIFLGLKPTALTELLPGISRAVAERTAVLVPLAAGVSLDTLNELAPQRPILRVMPNLNSFVGAGISAYCANEHCSQAQVSEVLGFISASGGVIELEEKYFDLFSVLAGSTPAFTYLYMDALARAALKLGMPKAQALEIAAQSVLGSAKMLLQSGEHPWELADRVCSPGGLTIEGICALQQNAFDSTVMQALERAVEKSRL